MSIVHQRSSNIWSEIHVISRSLFPYVLIPPPLTLKLMPPYFQESPSIPNDIGEEQLVILTLSTGTGSHDDGATT
jgi:hypothetical protein